MIISRKQSLEALHNMAQNAFDNFSEGSFQNRTFAAVPFGSPMRAAYETAISACKLLAMLSAEELLTESQEVR